MGDSTSCEKGSIAPDFKGSNVESGNFWVLAQEKRGGRLGSSFPEALGISMVMCLSLLVPQSSVFCDLMKEIPEVCDMQWQEPLTSPRQGTMWLHPHARLDPHVPLNHHFFFWKQWDGKNQTVEIKRWRKLEVFFRLKDQFSCQGELAASYQPTDELTSVLWDLSVIPYNKHLQYL